MNTLHLGWWLVVETARKRGSRSSPQIPDFSLSCVWDNWCVNRARMRLAGRIKITGPIDSAWKEHVESFNAGKAYVEKMKQEKAWKMSSWTDSDSGFWKQYAGEWLAELGNWNGPEEIVQAHQPSTAVSSREHNNIPKFWWDHSRQSGHIRSCKWVYTLMKIMFLFFKLDSRIFEMRKLPGQDNYGTGPADTTRYCVEPGSPSMWVQLGFAMWSSESFLPASIFFFLFFFSWSS